VDIQGEGSIRRADADADANTYADTDIDAEANTYADIDADANTYADTDIDADTVTDTDDDADEDTFLCTADDHAPGRFNHAWIGCTHRLPRGFV
jgi:hypothetical protein